MNPLLFIWLLLFSLIIAAYVFPHILAVLKQQEDINTKVNCKKMAITCFMKEIEVLKEENEDNESITNIIYRIQRNIHDIWREDLQNINQGNTCRQCEMYEAQHSKVFLQRLIEFLQFVYQTGF